jgi:hypothetical protein
MSIPRDRQQESKRKDLNITSMKQKGLYRKGDVDDYRYLSKRQPKVDQFRLHISHNELGVAQEIKTPESPHSLRG